MPSWRLSGQVKVRSRLLSLRSANLSGNQESGLGLEAGDMELEDAAQPVRHHIRQTPSGAG